SGRPVAGQPAPAARAPTRGASRATTALSVGSTLCAPGARAPSQGLGPVAAGSPAGLLAGTAPVGTGTAARSSGGASRLAAALQQRAGGRASDPSQAAQTPDVRTRKAPAVAQPLPEGGLAPRHAQDL